MTNTNRPNQDDAPIDLEPSNETDAPVAASQAEPRDERFAHLPPDEGPEVHVKTVRPSWFRTRPFLGSLLVVLPVAGAIATPFFFSGPNRWLITLIVLVSLVVICWGMIVFWWVTVTLSTSLRITNKRIVEQHGLLSRSTDEVVLDHIRNVRVDQTFRDRIFKVGKIGIASSGQDVTEIVVGGIPDPHELKAILDNYRTLG